MILFASGRTDIAAFYSEWLINRLKEGYIDVRNPFNKNLVSRILLSEVDLIFFCTKNPIPILDKINQITINTYFHITLTPYKKDIEPSLPSKKEMIKSIKELSNRIGKENIVIRYDPVFISEKYNLDYHKRAFESLCASLEGYVSKIVISFLDEYKNVKNHYSLLKYQKLEEQDYKEIGLSFSQSAKAHHLEVFTCFEDHNLIEYGFAQGECMSKELATRLTNKIYETKWNVRKEKKCHCVSMVDIGEYNTCKHYCAYCYANYDEKSVNLNWKEHDKNSSLLIGHLKDSDIIKIRHDKNVSTKEQLSLFKKDL